VHLILAVSDVERAKQFYGDAFGWKPHLEWPGEYAELELPDQDWLGLYREDGFAETAGAPVEELKRGRYGGAELYVQVDDVEEAMTSLRNAGAKALSPLARRGWGHEAAYFADPDGNIVAVARPVE
jgi:catechol 2,3-dioxygenase-like lactoylglutathione lyase family enzyme